MQHFNSFSLNINGPFRPLAGVKVQRLQIVYRRGFKAFRPLAGVKVQPTLSKPLSHTLCLPSPCGGKGATIVWSHLYLRSFFRPLAGVKVQQQNETKNKKRTNRTCHCFTVLILKYNITEAKKKQKRMNWAK